jgi:hypothetical protein
MDVRRARRTSARHGLQLLDLRRKVIVREPEVDDVDERRKTPGVSGRRISRINPARFSTSPVSGLLSCRSSYSFSVSMTDSFARSLH